MPSRIIPALAGNTVQASSARRPTWDHPRSRGEYTASASQTWTTLGSSPLSRGILAAAVARQPCTGIIPALAGNTRLGCSQDRGAGDHPRSRGEYLLEGVDDPPTRGSSPLSRGIQSEGGTHPRELRIIPALAGNTMLSWSRPVRRCGSSPLSRGILEAFLTAMGGEGIIPALAGNTILTASWGRVGTDHPRSRGEYVL